MSSTATMERRTLTALLRRTRSRGVSYVEVLVIVGVVLLLGVVAVTALGRSSSEHASREAECIKTFSCGGGTGGDGDVSSLAGKSASGASEEKGFWRTTGDIAAGFFVDGLWGTVKGVGTAIIHPVDTVTNIGSAIAHPINTATAIKDGIVTAWNENPERLIGAGLFEVVTLPIAATKGAKVAEAATVVEEAGKAARAAERLAEAGDAAKLAKRADELADVGDAAKLGKRVESACSGGICTNGSCFGAGTPVATPEGERPIETIAVGDLVLARDPETGATEPHRVAQVIITNDREVLDLGLEHADGSVEVLVVTPEHPFFREGLGFVAAESLNPGDAIVTADGATHVRSLASKSDRITVYNFEVEVAHTYFVGKTAAWVHNTCLPRVGDNVLVPRSDGSVSGGRIIGPAANGRVTVEVDVPGGLKGYKDVDPSSLIRRRQIGDEVVVPRSDGSTSVGHIIASHPDGRVTVTWEQNGMVAQKTVHESVLKDADRTVPMPVRKFGDPYVKPTDGYVPDRIFSDWVPPKGIPDEGWKMHVSTSPERSYQVADRVLPLLREMEVPHKVMTDPASYAQMTGGQTGKFITIYPESSQQAAEIARALDHRIKDLGEGAPVIAGERPLGNSGMIYTRYGGFTKSTVTDPRTGREVMDVRGQTSPPWIADPFTGL